VKINVFFWVFKHLKAPKIRGDQAQCPKEEFEEKSDDDTKLLQYLKIIWMKFPILNEIHPNIMWMIR